jgi:hypothetical protein
MRVILFFVENKTNKHFVFSVKYYCTFNTKTKPYNLYENGYILNIGSQTILL